MLCSAASFPSRVIVSDIDGCRINSEATSSHSSSLSENLMCVFFFGFFVGGGCANFCIGSAFLSSFCLSSFCLGSFCLVSFCLGVDFASLSLRFPLLCAVVSFGLDGAAFWILEDSCA
eukprot:TRINITY_DN2137_c0_g1_i4.p2 TRINITY_DN2137_c0_g1~~TRINITY_DN2137_c0_g1_i4.p2  ORF type:complete len:118 (+),score=19.25 TRINITY_DN2137_c0_g1_i4:389-742(+)